MKRVITAWAVIVFGASGAMAQEQDGCRVLCTPEFKVEPTVTFGNLFGAPRTVAEDGTVLRERRETDLEVILSLGLPTRISWLEFTVEAIFLPFDRDSTPELEFETNFTWLPAERTRGWISSHFDIVDKFSSAERPTDRRAYTHKMNLELDTSVSIFNWLAEGRWLSRVELEGSLDYVATGLPKRGDVIDRRRFLDDASPLVVLGGACPAGGADVNCPPVWLGSQCYRVNRRPPIGSRPYRRAAMSFLRYSPSLHDEQRVIVVRRKTAEETIAGAECSANRGIRPMIIPPIESSSRSSASIIGGVPATTYRQTRPPSRNPAVEEYPACRAQSSARCRSASAACPVSD